MPAYGNFIRDKGYDADAAITLYRAVKPGTSAESVTPCNTLGESGIGISQFGVSSTELTKGKGASVREDGTSEWEVGAANAGVIARGVDVTVDAAGCCQVAATGHRVWGKSRQASTAAGQRIAVDLAIVKYIKA
jgi:hypothetical protein